MMPLIAMTAHAGSALDKAADVSLIVPDSEEACPETLAPTTSTTVMIALGDAIAVALLERIGFSTADFQQRHPGAYDPGFLKLLNPPPAWCGRQPDLFRNFGHRHGGVSLQTAKNFLVYLVHSINILELL